MSTLNGSRTDDGAPSRTTAAARSRTDDGASGRTHDGEAAGRVGSTAPGGLLRRHRDFRPLWRGGTAGGFGGVLGTAPGIRTAMWITSAGVPPAALVLVLSPVGRARGLPAARPVADPVRPRSRVTYGPLRCAVAGGTSRVRTVCPEARGAPGYTGSGRGRNGIRVATILLLLHSSHLQPGAEERPRVHRFRR